MTHILIVEDTLEIAEALRHRLEREAYAVSLATKAAQALPMVSASRPGLIVLDLGLPDRDGYTVLEQLRARGDQTPVLILSARNMEEDKVKGFRLGADDYVTKPFGVAELLARVAGLLRRAALSRAPAAEPASTAAARITDDDLRTTYGLTARQLEVARLLAQGCSNADVAERLGVSEFTARNHTTEIFTKTGVHTRAAFVALLYGGE